MGMLRVRACLCHSSRLCAGDSTGRWVRTRAFREIDYDPAFPDRLLEFDSFDKAFAWNEERRADGTGGRHAKHMSKPKDSVPTEQLAMLVEMKEEAAKANLPAALSLASVSGMDIAPACE